MNFPRDINCEIASYITDPRDILRLMRVSKNNREILFRCVTTLIWNSPLPKNIKVPIKFISQFLNLRIIKLPIIIPGKDFVLSEIIFQFSRLEFIYIIFDLTDIPDMELFEKFNINTEKKFIASYQVIMKITSEIATKYYQKYKRIPDFIFEIGVPLYISSINVIIRKFKNTLLFIGDTLSYDKYIDSLMMTIDKSEGLYRISQIEIKNFDIEKFNKFSQLREIVLQNDPENLTYSGDLIDPWNIKFSIEMLKCKNLNTIIYPRNFWNSRIIENFNSELSRITIYFPQNINNKPLYLEIPFNSNVYYDLLGIPEFKALNIKVLGFYLESFHPENPEYFNKEIIQDLIRANINRINELMSTFNLEKIIMYIVDLELPKFYNNPIFEFRQVRE